MLDLALRAALIQPVLAQYDLGVNALAQQLEARRGAGDPLVRAVGKVVVLET